MKIKFICEDLNFENIIDFENNSIDIEILSEFLPNNLNILKFWIHHPQSNTWISFPNNIILNSLIKAFLLEEKTNILTIICRLKDDSPNSTPLKSDDSISTVSDNISFLSIKDYTILNDIEPFTQEKIEDLNFLDLVKLPLKNYTNCLILISAEAIIDYIKNELSKGTTFFEIKLDIKLKNNKYETLIFTIDIWTKYLIRKNILLNFFANIFSNSLSFGKELENLKSNLNLIFRLKIFIHDLLKLNDESIDRLSFYSLNYPKYYFSRFYFTENEIKLLLNFPTSTGLTCIDLINIVSLNTGNNEICSSHDIAPILYKIFDIKKNFDKDKDFIKNMKKFKGVL